MFPWLKVPSANPIQRAYLELEKVLSFINENQNLCCEYMFCVWNFKNINWEHVEFDEGKSDFLPLFTVYHILSETEVWPFSTASSSMNSSEMQH